MTRFDTWDSYFTDNPRDPGIPEDQRVLRNLLWARTAPDLAAQEKQITLLRVIQIERGEVTIAGSFDFAHHCAIHAHIFGDVYEWAGQPRTVDMSKAHRLWPAAGIEAQAPITYGAIATENYLRGLDHATFVAHLAEHWGEINVLHAFREGNTRSQRVFFALLCAQAGYLLDSAYLEAHYDNFLHARESAMLTADSATLADFLVEAITRTE